MGVRGEYGGTDGFDVDYVSGYLTCLCSKSQRRRFTDGGGLITGGRIMQRSLHIKTTVRPGGKVEIVSPELEVGQRVEVVVSPLPMLSARSAWQIISESEGHRLFKTAKEVDDYIAEERASWDR